MLQITPSAGKHTLVLQFPAFRHHRMEHAEVQRTNLVCLKGAEGNTASLLSVTWLIMNIYGCSSSTLSNRVYGKSWRHSRLTESTLSPENRAFICLRSQWAKGTLRNLWRGPTETSEVHCLQSSCTWDGGLSISDGLNSSPASEELGETRLNRRQQPALSRGRLASR